MMFEIVSTTIDRVRVGFLCVAWIAALTQVLTDVFFIWIVNIGVISFVIFLILTFYRLRRDTLMIVSILVFVGYVLLPKFPTTADWFEGGRNVLIFTALLPTMALVRATATMMPSVLLTQKSLSNLPPSAAAGGFHIAANFFGAIINTGSLAILSAALPKNVNASDRLAAAEAALRGMVTAAAWSPFFIAFAVGQAFVGELHAWVAIGIGVITSGLFTIISLPILSRGVSIKTLRMAFSCLRPVLFRLLIILSAVLISALSFGFTALSSVVVVMPILVIVQFARHRHHVKSIVMKVGSEMKKIGDDILIISLAMLIGYFATRAGAFSTIISDLHSGMIPGWFALITTPLVMMILSVFGVHPVISSTALLAIFSGGRADVNPALLMQAHLIGWGAGTMSSIASLSVIMCSSLYKVPSRKLVFGNNFLAALFYALVGGCILSLINFLV